MSDASSPQPAKTPAAETRFPQSMPTFRHALILIGVLGLVLPWCLWLVVRQPPPTHSAQAKEALRLLQEGRLKSANRLALNLLKQQVNDSEIGGTLEYVVGIAHYHKAESLNQSSEIQLSGAAIPVYELTIRYLEQANTKTFQAGLQPEWTFTLADCYYKLGNLYQARELFEQAYHSYPDRRAEILLKLSHCYLDPNVLQASLIHSSDLLESRKKLSDMLSRIEQALSLDASDIHQQLTDTELVLLKLARGEFLLLSGDFPQAILSLENLQAEIEAAKFSEEIRSHLADHARLLKARIALSQGETGKSRELIQKLLTEHPGLEQNETLQAYYITGLAFAKEDRIDRAIELLDKAALAVENPISFPATLQAGEFSRKRGLHEEALRYYLRSFSLVKSPQKFTNRWISLASARQMIHEAWEEWTNSGRHEHFRFAMELAKNSTPVLTQTESNRLLAVATRKRAELVQQETDALKSRADQYQKSLALKHWQQAGLAYAKLAESAQATESYGQYLWEACLLYRQGNDFVNAFKMIQAYINSNPRTGLPAALILKARVLLDLAPYSQEDQLPEVIDILKNLIRDYPRDQSVYEAQVLLGEAYLENLQNDLAIETWRRLLLESPLTPDATEWQNSLFSLGRTLFLLVDTRPEILTQRADSPELSEQDRQKQAQKITEAIHWLEEFIRRNPRHPQVTEARWLLAKGLQASMQQRHHQIKTAETANLRSETIKEVQKLGLQATEYFLQLESELAILEQKGELNEVSRRILKNSYFEPAHIQFQLGKYDSTGDTYRKAVDLYSNAAFRFSGQAEVLVAYYRIAECYRELGSDDEARRQIEQARVILSQLEEPFSADSTNFNREQWNLLLEQALKLYDISLESNSQTSRRQ